MLYQQLINGVVIGSLYALIAYSYALIFGILQIIFFAQGELIMLAPFFVFACFGFFCSFLPVDLALLASCFVALALTILVGVTAEKVTLTPLRNAPSIKALISSLGLSIVLQNAAMLIWGRHTSRFIEPLSSPGVISTPYFVVTDIQIIIVVVALLVVVGLDIFFNFSRYGLGIRAVSQSKTGARLMGIDPDKAITVTFVVASILAFTAGVLMASYHGVIRFNMGFTPGIKGLTAAILGGSGNLRGAFAAGILLGVSETLFAGYISSDYKDVLAFLILITILLIKPSGIFGKADRKG